MNTKPAGSFYRHIIRDAWNVTRRSRVLWIFGFFTALLGNGGIYELLIQRTNRLGLQEDLGAFSSVAWFLPNGGAILSALRRLGAFNDLIIISLVIAGAALLAVAVWVIISSQGALITGIREADKGKKPGFRELFSEGGEPFWHLLGLNVISRIFLSLLFYLILAMLVLLMAKATLVRSLLFLLTFLALMPLSLIVGLVTLYGANYIVLHRLRLIESMEMALVLFKDYWLISLETAVIVFAINVLASLVIAAGLAALAVLFLPLMFGAALLPTTAGISILAALGIMLILAVLILAGSVLSVFQTAVWTLLFQKLHQRGIGATPKLFRLFNRWFGFAKKA